MDNCTFYTKVPLNSDTLRILLKYYSYEHLSLYPKWLTFVYVHWGHFYISDCEFIGITVALIDLFQESVDDLLVSVCGAPHAEFAVCC